MRFYYFLKVKICTCRRCTKACFHGSDFQSKNFWVAIFIIQKQPFYVNFSILLADNDFFLDVPHLLRVWDFEGMYLIYLEIRTWRGTFHNYFKKWFLLAFRTVLYPFGHRGKKTFLSPLNVMILKMVRNEHLRFGGHVDIEVRYNILRLDVLQRTQILHNLSCFE